MFEIPHRICFEIQGIAHDENGAPAPTGLCITVAFPLQIPYEKLAECVNIPGVLKMSCLDGIVSPEDVRIITPEEYDERYGG